MSSHGPCFTRAHGFYEFFDNSPCHQHEGMKLVYVEPGKVATEVLVPTEHTTSDKNFIQGGYFVVYVDSPMWLATLTFLETEQEGVLDAVLRQKKMQFVTSLIEINFFYSIKSGDILDIVARYIDVSPLDEMATAKKTVYFAAADVFDQRGNLVARVRRKSVC